ncbi:hypothetical protein BJ742DRAFT_766400 [Cladochytrium replicatum]|nr:hypothetical protein BJ742DRAFT_766400 [Cladochytrium replicatum]
MNDPAYDGFGMKVTAIRDIQVDEELCTISKEAILSPKNCGIADIFEETGVSGTLGLTIALMYEMSLGVHSPWYGYLQSLPRHEDFKSLPLYWSEEHLRLLQNTDLETMTKIYVSASKGEEIYNTYGKLSNLWLFFRYGYTEVDNPYDIVEVPWEAVVEWVERNALFKSSRSEANQRIDLWKRVRKNFKHLWTDEDDGDDDESDYDGEEDGSDRDSDTSDRDISVDEIDDLEACDGEHDHEHGDDGDVEVNDSDDEDEESNQSWSRDH